MSILLTPPASAGTPSKNPSAGIKTSLAVQVMADDKRLVVTQVLGIDAVQDHKGPSEKSWKFPLLLPGRGPVPSMVGRSEKNPDGINVQTGRGTRVAFNSDGLTVTGDPASPGGVRVQTKYTVPVTAGSVPFLLRPTMDLNSLQFVTRRNATWGMQLRPMVPYSFREEVEEDGTWQYMNVIHEIRAGTTVRVQAGHLPSPFGPYRFAGVLAMLLAIGILLLGMASRRGGKTES
ncbi:MAG: hypothetical protein GXP54_05520 [Deltaproteobacteria bacterium]|nr:hypothetical protein [Deltaproteobacteria bacterium]